EASAAVIAAAARIGATISATEEATAAPSKATEGEGCAAAPIADRRSAPACVESATIAEGATATAATNAADWLANDESGLSPSSCALRRRFGVGCSVLSLTAASSS